MLVPVWLGWMQDEWLKYREGWHNQIHTLLDVEEYLQTYFHADERVRSAELELADAGEKGDLPDVRLKRAFLQRVLALRENQRRLLRADGVPAPNDASARWMLFGLHQMRCTAWPENRTCLTLHSSVAA